MRRAAALATLLGVFVLGAAVGVLGTHLVHLRHGLGPHTGPPEFGLVGAWLERRLDLTREQSARIEAILDRHHQEMFELRREMMPEFEDRFAATVEEIEAVLTPDQRERFRRIHPPFGHFRHRHRDRDRTSAPPAAP